MAKKTNIVKRNSIPAILIIIIVLLPLITLSGDNPYQIMLELYSDEKEVRMDAVMKLAGMYSFWSIERLIQILLTDDDDDLRLQACNIVSDRIDSRAIQAFTYTINDENIYIRLCSIKALSNFINEYPIDTLIERLYIEDNDIYGVNKDYYEINLTSHYNVRKEIVKTLAKITHMRKKVLLRDRVIEVLKNYYDVEEDWSVRIEILESVLMLDRTEGIELLKRSLRSETELYVMKYSESKLREISMGAFADKILKERNMLRSSVMFDKNLADLNQEELIDYIKKNKEQYISTLLFHYDYRKRLDAVKKLGMIANNEVVDFIEQALSNDESKDVRWACILQLAECGDEDSVNVLIKAFYDPLNKNLKMEIIRALSKLGVNRTEY